MIIIQWFYIYKIKILYSLVASVALNFHLSNFEMPKYFSILNLWSFFNVLCFFGLKNFLTYFVNIFLNKILVNNMFLIAAMIWCRCVVLLEPTIGNNIILCSGFGGRSLHCVCVLLGKRVQLAKLDILTAGLQGEGLIRSVLPLTIGSCQISLQ